MIRKLVLWLTGEDAEIESLRANLAALTSNYEAMYEARYQAGYEAGIVHGMAEQRELTRAAHSVRGQKAAQTRKQRQEAA